MIVNAGGVAAVVDYVSSTRGNVRLPGIMMLGYTAAHTESLAMAVIVSKVIVDMKSLSSWLIIDRFSGHQSIVGCLERRNRRSHIGSNSLGFRYWFWSETMFFCLSSARDDILSLNCLKVRLVDTHLNTLKLLPFRMSSRNFFNSTWEQICPKIFKQKRRKLWRIFFRNAFICQFSNRYCTKHRRTSWNTSWLNSRKFFLMTRRPEDCLSPVAD